MEMVPWKFEESKLHFKVEVVSVFHQATEISLVPWYLNEAIL